MRRKWEEAGEEWIIFEGEGILVLRYVFLGTILTGLKESKFPLHSKSGISFSLHPLFSLFSFLFSLLFIIIPRSKTSNDTSDIAVTINKLLPRGTIIHLREPIKIQVVEYFLEVKTFHLPLLSDNIQRVSQMMNLSEKYIGISVKVSERERSKRRWLRGKGWIQVEYI